VNQTVWGNFAGRPFTPGYRAAEGEEFILSNYPAQYCHRFVHMVETRIAPRYPIHKPAVAEYGGDKYPCTVRDRSVTGAAAEFNDPADAIPIKKAFTLIMPDDRLKLPCRIVWQRGYRMGVTFE